MISARSPWRRPCEVVMPIWRTRPSARQALSVSRCLSQPSRLWICRTSNRSIPHLRREASIWRMPWSWPGVQTLVAEIRPGGCPKAARPRPMTSSDVPYMGEESIRPPPMAKKVLRTSLRCVWAAASSPMSKVSQLPMPMTGMRRFVEGTALVRGRGAAWARRGKAAVRPAAPVAIRKRRRVGMVGLYLKPRGRSSHILGSGGVAGSTSRRP